MLVVFVINFIKSLIIEKIANLNTWMLVYMSNNIYLYFKLTPYMVEKIKKIKILTNFVAIFLLEA